MKLKLMLVKYHITAKQLAEKIGLSRQTVTNRITGYKGVWTEPDMAKVWDYFKENVDENIKITDLFF